MASDNPSTKHQADTPDDDDDKIEVPPAFVPGHHAEAQADQRKWDDQPIGPAEQRNEGDDAQDQRNSTDEERKKVQHPGMMRVDCFARKIVTVGGIFSCPMAQSGRKRTLRRIGASRWNSLAGPRPR